MLEDRGPAGRIPGGFVDQSLTVGGVCLRGRDDGEFTRSMRPGDGPGDQSAFVVIVVASTATLAVLATISLRATAMVLAVN